MSNSFTETTSVSWFGRLRNSVGGVVIGLLLIIGMVVLLFWNEGRAVTTARSLAEGAGAVVSVGADAVEPTNEGKLIHVSGTVTTDSDPERRRFRDQRARRAAGPQCRDVSVEGRIPLRDDQEARRRRGNHHHLHLFQGMGRRARSIPVPSSSLPGTRIRRWTCAAVPSRYQRASSARSISTSRCWIRIGGDQPMAITPDQAAAIEAGLCRHQEGEHRQWAHLSRLEPVIAGDRRLPHLLRGGAARRHQRDRPAAGLAVPGLPDDRRRSAC